MKHRLPSILFCILTTLSAHAQVQKINTYAGIGTAGFSGDGYAATNAQLDGPYAVALDQSGNLYIADFFNYRVRKVNTLGKISTVAGTGNGGFSGEGTIATSANLQPHALTVDKNGNLYIADAQAAVIRKMNTSGIITTIAGIPLSFGYTGNGGLATSAKLNSPHGMTFDRQGRLVFADAGNHVVRRISATGIITTIAGNDTAGNTGDGGFAVTARLDSPFAVAVDKKGNLYISDMLNHRIRKVDTFGVITNYAGNASAAAGYDGDNGPATSAHLNRPAGIALDSAGNLFIADEYNNVIRKVDTFGVITTVAGNGSWGSGGDLGEATSANLHTPYDVTVDAAGSLYIADANNHRVRKTYFGTVGVNTVAYTEITLYPNPANESVTIEGLTAGDNIRISNMVGRAVATATAAHTQQEISVSTLPSGVYLVHVTTAHGELKAAIKLTRE
jgi:sugar lactone lactonase YvrE